MDESCPSPVPRSRPVSDAPTDPAPSEDESALGLGWLFDETAPGDEEEGNSAIWPTEPVDMLPLPGFTLDEDSVLTPLPSAPADEDAEAEPLRLGSNAPRVRGGRLRVALRSRAGAGAGVLGSMLLVTVAAAGIGLPGGGSDEERPTPSPSRDAPPTVALDTSWTADLVRTVKVAERRQQLAERRSAARRAEARERSRQEAAARATSPTPTAVSSPAAETASPPADPWAGVPGPVREFEPGPWNDGGATS